MVICILSEVYRYWLELRLEERRLYALDVGELVDIATQRVPRVMTVRGCLRWRLRRGVPTDEGDATEPTMSTGRWRSQSRIDGGAVGEIIGE